MSKTLTAIFDGDVLRPDSPLDLKPNTRYVITIQSVDMPVAQENAWDVLEAMTGTVEAPSDWSSEHDRYLYGTPLRQPHILFKQGIGRCCGSELPVQLH